MARTVADLKAGQELIYVGAEISGLTGMVGVFSGQDNGSDTAGIDFGVGGIAYVPVASLRVPQPAEREAGLEKVRDFAAAVESQRLSYPLLDDKERAQARQQVLTVADCKVSLEAAIRPFGELDYLENKGAVEFTLIDDLEQRWLALTPLQAAVLALDLLDENEDDYYEPLVLTLLSLRDDCILDRRLWEL